MNELGMRMRRPRGSKKPSDEEIEKLEAQAERLASKAPGEAPQTFNSSTAVVVREVVPKKTKKAQVTAYLPSELRDELRYAAVALAGPPHMETVTGIVERAIRRELSVLKEAHGPFQETTIGPRPGRRVGS